MERVGKKHKYICVESYRNEIEKANLLYWQVYCKILILLMNGYGGLKRLYSGDYSFIYFNN